MLNKASASAADNLKRWSQGSTRDRLNRLDHTDLEDDRRVIVVVGITGAGKSSTANTLAGRLLKQFSLSNSVTSVTQSVSFRDYDFVGERWRIIDTPGLSDTNKSGDEVREELLRLARYSPKGVTAFVVVVPRGRFTPEQESVLRELDALFGPGLKRHAVIAVTSATDQSEGRNLIPRDVLIDEINNLPLRHFYRRFVEDCKLRLVPVENREDPGKQISRMSLHQRILEIDDANGKARYDTAHFAQVQPASSTGVQGMHDSNATEAVLRSLQLGHCVHKLSRRVADNRLVLGIECELKER